MTIIYTRDRPDPPHNPSVDVGAMRDNTNAIDDIIDVDHFSFNDTPYSGKHKQTRFVNNKTPPIPTTAAGELALYSKGANLGPSQLFMVRDNNVGTEVALTPDPTVIGNVFRAQSGFSWLPGNMLIQWGFTAGIVVGGGSINFPQPFELLGFLPVVTITPFPANTSTQNIYLGPTTNTLFSYFNNNSNITNLYWIAIGPAGPPV